MLSHLVHVPTAWRCCRWCHQLACCAGVTEAFVHAVLDTRQLAWSNVVLVALTGAHLGASVACIRALGSVGFVLADSINMALRIGVSLW